MKKSALKRSSRGAHLITDKRPRLKKTARRPRPLISSPRPKIIVILGTTASGKSALALRLAKHFKGIIIAADARTIYRGLNIGTAKPTKKEQKQVPHFMIDVISPRQTYSAQKYQTAVKRIIQQHKNQPIFLVGGNGLYIDAITKGLNFAGIGPDEALRTKLNNKSLPQLNQMLRQKDPKGYLKVDRQNKRRVVRALEVVIRSGSSIFTATANTLPARDITKIGLTKPRPLLRQRINTRIDKMFRAGWVAEVRRLLVKYPAASPGFSAHGYPEIIQYLKGQLTKEEAKARVSRNVWLYAKRQLNWFGKDNTIRWLDERQFGLAKKIVNRFLKK